MNILDFEEKQKSYSVLVWFFVLMAIGTILLFYFALTEIKEGYEEERGRMLCETLQAKRSAPLPPLCMEYVKK